MAYRRSRLAHLILYIFVTILCQPLGTPGADVPTTSVNGQITDSESGAPLGSASIRLEGPITSTATSPISRVDSVSRESPPVPTD